MNDHTEIYNELCCYTLEHGDPAFLHQHVVDAFMAQHADERTKPIGVAFALVGLYLHVVKGFSGKQVQRTHMTLAQRKRTWPTFALPRERGDLTVADVMTKDAGPDRDAAIDQWCASVWNAYRASHHAVIELLREYGIV